MNQKQKLPIAREADQAHASQAGGFESVLIVAYGNPLRSDDGLAWHAADELERRLPSDHVAIIRRHQLTPELAQDLSRHATVIFVDAAAPGSETATAGKIRVEEIHAPPSGGEDGIRFSHQCSPTSLVDMAAQLYLAKPKAVCVTLTGENFAHGESLSSAVKASLPALVARVEALVRDIHRGGS